MYKIYVQTIDWTCEESAEKAKLAMEKTLESLSPEKYHLWAETWHKWYYCVWPDNYEVNLPELEDACTQAELVGLEGWASEPKTGHGITIHVDKLT